MPNAKRHAFKRPILATLPYALLRVAAPMMPLKVLQTNGFVVEGFPPERIWNLDRLCAPLHVINVPVRAALWAHKQSSIRTLTEKAKLPGRDELGLFIVAAVHDLLELLTAAHVLSDRFIWTGIVPCHTYARRPFVSTEISRRPSHEHTGASAARCAQMPPLTIPAICRIARETRCPVERNAVSP